MDGYNTNAILQTLRKFVTIRGCPSEYIFDQGTQLVAAAKDLADLTKDWNWGIAKDWCSNNKITWELISTEGQHQNGLAESMIKCAKRSIKHVIGENILTSSDLHLVFYEISNIINSRPIGILTGSNADSPTHITPNDLLFGRSSHIG